MTATTRNISRLQATIRSGTGCPSVAVHEFYYAIAMNDVEAVRSFIQQKRVSFTAADDFGLTCLHIACVHNRTRMLHILKPHVPVSLLAAVTLRLSHCLRPSAVTVHGGQSMDAVHEGGHRHAGGQSVW